MPYMIDGHNLIGKLPGLSLQQPDDEERLIERVLQFCRVAQKTAEIYFDNAPAGTAGRRKFGRVTAVFVRAGSTADAAIQRRLRELGRQARNWTVVSSDRQVQAEGRSTGAQVLASEQFAQRLAGSPPRPESRPEPSLSPEEVQDWLDEFNARGPDEGFS